jgi:hypothetical protein
MDQNPMNEPNVKQPNTHKKQSSKPNMWPKTKLQKKKMQKMQPLQKKEKKKQTRDKLKLTNYLLKSDNWI